MIADSRHDTGRRVDVARDRDPDAGDCVGLVAESALECVDDVDDCIRDGLRIVRGERLPLADEHIAWPDRSRPRSPRRR